MAAAAPPLRIRALIKQPPALSDCEVTCSASVAGGGKALNKRSCGRQSLATGFRLRRERFRGHCQDERYWSLWDPELDWICLASQSLRWNSCVEQQLSIAGKRRECWCRCFGQQIRRRKNNSRVRWPGFERTGGPLEALCARGSSLRGLLIIEENGEATLTWKGRSKRRFRLRASRDLYETLGVPTTATEKEIKQAYRKLALKFHPDVNKEPDAQQKFLQIKNAYQILIDEKDRAKYDRSRRSSTSWDPFARQSGGKSAQKQREEEFYGFGQFFKDVTESVGDFFRDLQEDRRKRPASKPKSLWEELAEVGEEFVEFLEKELNISDTTQNTEKSSGEKAWDEKRTTYNRGAKNSGSAGGSSPQDKQADKEQESADIEEMLAKLKKEMGM